jgi:hypothetical protein
MYDYSNYTPVCSCHQEVVQKFTYMEWFSKSLDRICSFTLFAFLDNFFRIAEAISPVTDIKIAS